HGLRRDTLARTRFSDDPQCLSLIHSKRQASHRLDDSVRSLEGNSEIAHFEESHRSASQTEAMLHCPNVISITQFRTPADWSQAKFPSSKGTIAASSMT